MVRARPRPNGTPDPTASRSSRSGSGPRRAVDGQDLPLRRAAARGPIARGSMSTLIVLAALALIAIVLHDGFEVILLPRRVGRGLRLTRLFYTYTWWFWRAAAGLVRTPKGRDR